VQHGLALSKEEDPERPLSEKGKAETRKVAAFLGSKGIKVSRLWHSKKLRAVQTARIIAGAVKCEDVTEREDLSPNDPVEKFGQEIIVAGSDVMIVGHLPFLQKLASLLLTGSSDKEVVSFRFSGVVCLEYEQIWKLAWFVLPDLC